MGFDVCAAGFLFDAFVYVGGSFNNNGMRYGFFAWNCLNASSHSNWNYGARLLIVNIIKNITHHFPCRLAKISHIWAGLVIFVESEKSAD